MRKPSKAEIRDRAADKKAGIKQGSPEDIKRDKAAGVYKEEYGSKKSSKTPSKKGAYPSSGNYP